MEPVENNNGPQTTTVYGSIQTRDGDGNPEKRKTNRADLPRTGNNRFVGLQMAAGISGKSAGDIRGQGDEQPGESGERARGGVGTVGGPTDDGKCASKKGQQLAGNTTTEKRDVIQTLRADAPVKQLCTVFNCPRSTYYYQPVRRDDGPLLDAIEAVLMHRPWYGYRRVVAQLKREGVAAGETVVRRLLRSMQHSRSVGAVRVKTTDSRHPYTRYTNLIRGMHPNRPNQIWVADITYIRMGTRFIYLAVILDAYSRAVRGWAVSRSLSQELTLNALAMALATGKPLIFHSDQGSQYAAWLHTDQLINAGVRVSMSDKGKPTQNGIAERFMRTLKDEHVDYADYADFTDAQRQIAHWLEFEYNTQRIHSSLNYATPAEFEQLTSSAPSV